MLISLSVGGIGTTLRYSIACMTTAHAAKTETSDSSRYDAFDWPLAEAAEALLRQFMADFINRNSSARQLAHRLTRETGTDFFEWIDHLILPSAPATEAALRQAGFVSEPGLDTPGGEIVLGHPQATLPRVLLGATATITIALKPEFVAPFVAALGLTTTPEGAIYSRYRRILVAEEDGTRLEAIERCAYRGFLPGPLQPGELENILRARELWFTRPRACLDPAEGFRQAHHRLDQILALVGRDRACQYFFEAERAFWENRNLAGRIQKHRQDQLGLGWGNHDHHTFRCSRPHFARLVHFLDRLGLQKRERFYAGAEAGWGAQVMEQPVTGIVVFADVDLLPEETQIDFASHELPPAGRLGTVGLWAGLHGESFLEAGMHHLEARFDFDSLRGQLRTHGIQTLQPFSDFAFLRQAFTEGERWPVNPPRLDQLLREGLITSGQAEKFRREGAIGSHLENLQRHGGFKGFNQKSVSAVIAATDPRLQHHPPVASAETA